MSELIDELLEDAAERMSKSVDATNHEFASVRTGRASPALLDRVHVDYYGASTPLKQLATINAAEAQLLTVQPYDKSSMKAIEQGITEANLGLTPSNDGNIIRLVIPQLTEERRREFVKMVRHIAEEGRIAIRNVRRDVMHDLRELKEGGDVGADEEHRAETSLTKLTNDKIAELDTLLKGKEEEILEVYGPRPVRDRGARRVTTERGEAARYVAIITDGNGRWAKARGLPSSRATAPAPTTSRRACATRASSGSRS